MATTIMNDAASTVPGIFPFPEINSAIIGSVQVSTSTTFIGSTGTVTLQASNDNSVWSQVYADDNTTALSFTLSNGFNIYDWLIKNMFYKYYRILYTPGNASAGTVKAVLNIRS